MRRQFLFGFIALCLTYSLGAQLLRDSDRDAVAMRMIAHQIMLWQGDSSQAIPPVIALENSTYRINFNTDIQFEPAELVDFIEQVTLEYQIAQDYRVQVRSCVGDSIIYSYQVGKTEQHDIVPCIGRMQKKACYYLKFQILSEEIPQERMEFTENQTLDQESGLIPNWVYLLVFLIILLVVLGYIKLKNVKNDMPKRVVGQHETMQIGATTFSQQSLSLIFKDEKTELSAKEADLLAFLAENLNQRVEKELILKEVWGDEGDYVGRTLDVFISKLRKKLARDTSIRIVNIRGVGYQLLVE